MGPRAFQRRVYADYALLQQCAAETPSSAGRSEFVAAIKIGADGVPTDVRVKTEAKGADAALVACALEAFRKMTFPAPNHGSAGVLYPVRL